MIAVIADDITGAAEMAGIGFRFGLRTALMTETGKELPECDILVFATDTRSMSENEAVEETKRVVCSLREAGVWEFFKKTDSALRGHVVAELRAMLEETTYTKVLYLPENPSLGRVVKDGVYYINGQPLHETSFAYDPEFPATTSVVTERLPGVQRFVAPLSSWRQEGDGDTLPIYIADAENRMQIGICLATAGADVLYAGSADLFTTYLQLRFLGRDAMFEVPASPAFPGFHAGRMLIVCGSTQSVSLADDPYVQAHAIPVCQMPEEVFEGKLPAGEWVSTLRAGYRTSAGMVLFIGYPSKGGKVFAERLRRVFAEATEALVTDACPDELVIEGGATAFAILRALGWRHFRVTNEIAPGVVRMVWTGNKPVHVTLKPGSYSWGSLFRQG